MPRYVFECPGGHVFEKLVKRGVKRAVCPECGLNASYNMRETLKGFDWRRGKLWVKHGYATDSLERHRPGTSDGTGMMT